MQDDQERSFELTIKVTLRASEAAVKDAVVRSMGRGDDPESALQRASLREQLGLSAFDDQTWPAISRATETGQSAYGHLVGEAIRVGFEKVAPELGPPSTWTQPDSD